MVISEVGSPTIAAFYAWTMSSLGHEEVPDRFLRGVGRYPQPYALLARLGVSLDHEGRGLGRLIVKDVMESAIRVSGMIGCRGLRIDAETEAAKAYYWHLVPEFVEARNDPMKLLMLKKDIRRVLAEGRLD